MTTVLRSSLPLPPPSAFDLPPTFAEWRPQQEDAIQSVQDQRTRFLGLGMPTGSGKSLAAVAMAVLGGKRACILTHSKGLQDQYMEVLGRGLVGMEEIRGQDNYRCLAVPPYPHPYTSVKHGPCREGMQCRLMQDGCTYYDQVRKAREAQIVVTNYAYWMAVNEHAEGLGWFDLLICDEADLVFDALGSYISVGLEREWVERHLDLHLPGKGSSLPVLLEWAGGALGIADQKLKGVNALLLTTQALPNRRTILVRQREWLEDAVQSLKRLLSLSGRWAEVWGDHGERVDLHPVWPSRYAEQYLWLGIPQIVLMSGTLSEKAMTMLELGERGEEDGWELIDYPSPIPAERRRVIHIPAASMRASRADYGAWVRRIDQIVAARLDRKIIVDTVSYDRAGRLMDRTAFASFAVTHRKGERGGVERAVAEFRRSSPPAVLVSPSIGRGYDFQGDQCRVGILGKVPFPDSRDPLTRARTEEDKDYPMYLAMLSVQQFMGRTVRDEDDWSELFVTDDDFLWFWRAYRKFASQYFRDAVEWEGGGKVVSRDLIPEPP